MEQEGSFSLCDLLQIEHASTNNEENNVVTEIEDSESSDSEPQYKVNITNKFPKVLLFEQLIVYM